MSASWSSATAWPAPARSRRSWPAAATFAITMFGDEPYGNYNRIMLSNVLAGVEDESGHLPQRPEPGTRTTASRCTPAAGSTRIDRHAKRVYADDGTATPYDKLIIATGSRAFVPPIPGIHRPGRGYHQGVFAFRTLDDTRAMIRYAREHERAVVIGGGLLGLEAARGLQNHLPPRDAACTPPGT